MARHHARFEVFRGMLASWQTLFSQAAAFASQVGPRRVISISHSEDQNEGVVTIWYWATDPVEPEPHSSDDFTRDDEDAVEWKPGQ